MNTLKPKWTSQENRNPATTTKRTLTDTAKNRTTPCRTSGFDAFRAETDSKWTQPKRAISNGNGAYSILCYPYAAEYEPETFGKYTLLINPANAEPPIEKHLAFLNRRVRIPLHKSWANYVWEESLDKEWLEEIHHYGDYRYWIMKPNEELLEALISTHVKYGMLKANEE